MDPAAYLAWCRRWMESAARLLTPDGSMWVLISDDWAADFKGLLCGAGLHLRRGIIWHETFGQYNSREDNFSAPHRHRFYLVRDPRPFVFHAEAIRVRSKRLKLGDGRANPAGMVPGDVWTIPRVAGRHRERIKGF